MFIEIIQTVSLECDEYLNSVFFRLVILRLLHLNLRFSFCVAHRAHAQGLVVLVLDNIYHQQR